MARAATAWPCTYAGAVPSRSPCRWHAPPQPTLVGFEGSVAEPCVLHPEQVVTYPYAGSLPGRLGARIDAWEEAQERKAEKDGLDDELVTYHPAGR
ncbi:hypothetical protein [Streptomyces sp. NPDC005181]|uniref:hypothetical protein n=1 Tax=Streptomyces sp. NPDC005181 TaxID=3156869 RepID=UPI0033AC4783